MPISVPFTGGCPCGAIRYAGSAAPFLTFNCHCRDCQRASGSPFLSLMWVAAPAFTLQQGTPSSYTVPVESGHQVTREFCPTCGALLFAHYSTEYDVVSINVVGLDDPGGFEPLADMWTSSAHPWILMNPDIPKFAAQATEEDIQAIRAAQG